MSGIAEVFKILFRKKKRDMADAISLYKIIKLFQLILILSRKYKHTSWMVYRSR